MTDALRKKLQKRAKLWNTKLPTPSETKSERLRKKLARGQPVCIVKQSDCNGCPKYPCGESIVTCDEVSRTDRCQQCGIKVLYRYVEGEQYICPICIGRRR